MGSSAISYAARPVTTPSRRVVDYLKHTWKRVTRSPKTGVHPLQLSSPLSMRRSAGVCMDRTQLNDVVDDDDLTIVPSNISHGSSTADSCGPSSPAICDSDWRHFVDTPMKSSPSSFLGPWSRPPNASSGQVVRTRSGRSGLSTPCSSMESTCSIEDERVDEGIEVFHNYYATPPASALEQTKKDSFSRYREDIAQGSTSSSGRASNATPTPAVRPSARPLHRRVSDSAIDTTTIPDLNQLLEDTRMEDCSRSRARSASDDVSDRWSFISVRGESTTNDLLQYDTSELPANKRRKVSGKEEDPSRIMINGGEGHAQLQLDTPRTHPRYSGAYSVDSERRVLNTVHGPAVFMAASSAGRA